MTTMKLLDHQLSPGGVTLNFDHDSNFLVDNDGGICELGSDGSKIELASDFFKSRLADFLDDCLGAFPKEARQILRRVADKLAHVIPMLEVDMPDWSQPSREDIHIKGQNAFMSQATFQKLADVPLPEDRVEPGMMWRRSVTGNGIEWYLMWYGAEDKNHECPMYNRRIVLTD